MGVLGRRFVFGSLAVCVVLNGMLSPAMIGLMAHVLAYTHDTKTSYGALHRTSSHVILWTGVSGVVDVFLLTTLALLETDVPCQMNVTGRKMRRFLVRVHPIAATVALVALLRAVAAAVYANYDWYRSEHSIDQDLGAKGEFYTPETWLCDSKLALQWQNQTTLCREAQGARYATVLSALLSIIIGVLVLWRWRMRNLQMYGGAGSGDEGKDEEMGKREMESSSAAKETAKREMVAPQEVMSEERFEMPHAPVVELEGTPVSEFWGPLVYKEGGQRQRPEQQPVKEDTPAEENRRFSWWED